MTLKIYYYDFYSYLLANNCSSKLTGVSCNYFTLIKVKITVIYCVFTVTQTQF